MIDLSIIIPVYNVASYLSVCLESIFGQTGFSFEVILVDDASTDRSASICQLYAQKDARVRYVRHTSNAGLSCARNSGLQLAIGKYITFIDSDDFLAEGTLTQGMHYLLQDDEIDVLEYPVQVYYGSEQSYLYQPAQHVTKENYQQWVERGGYRHSYASNKIYRRSLWQGMTFPKGRYFEDLFVVPWVLQRASCLLSVPTGIYYYCSRSGSITAKGNFKKHQDLLDATLALYQHFLMDNCWSSMILDKVYLHVMDRQIDVLQAGGQLQIPSRRSIIRMLFSSGISLPVRIKVLLGGVFGSRACQIYCCLSKYLYP